MEWVIRALALMSHPSPLPLEFSVSKKLDIGLIRRRRKDPEGGGRRGEGPLKSLRHSNFPKFRKIKGDGIRKQTQMGMGMCNIC